jgi:hypothetical protein
MDVPLSPLEFARRTRRLYADVMDPDRLPSGRLPMIVVVSEFSHSPFAAAMPRGRGRSPGPRP